METLELKRTVLKVNVYGEDVEINFPTLDEIKALTKREENGDAIEAMIDFLDTLGLKKELSSRMEMPHIKKIIEVISSEKKD